MDALASKSEIGSMQFCKEFCMNVLSRGLACTYVVLILTLFPLTHHAAFSVIKFFFPPLELLKVIRETENDDLTGVMQKLISTYGHQEQVASIAIDIARDLVGQIEI